MKKIILASVFLFSCSKDTFAKASTPEAAATSEEMLLGPLLDLYAGGQAVGVAQPITVKNSNGTVTLIKGSLNNGTLLPARGEGFIRGGDATTSWGTGVMVSLITNSAAQFAREISSGNVIRIGSLAREHGGQFGPHKSHQNGLDADILYLGTKDWSSVLDAKGAVTEKFQTAKNWDYWRLLVSQKIMDKGKPTSVVSMILVDPRIKTYLCNWTKAKGYDQSPLDQEILRLLRPTAGHDDHFHLRLKCSPYYAKCVQQGDYIKGTGC